MLLEVDRLTLETDGPRGPAPLVCDVSLQLERGQTLALVGESGSGKTLTGLAVLGLLPPAVRFAQGAVRLDGRDLRAGAVAEWRAARGRRIAAIFQEPAAALNPVLPIGRQIGEGVAAPSRAARRQRVLTLLRDVGLADAERVARAYPHELSGGMQQRAMIALALAGEPDVLIADEPTTALDPTLQGQILDLLTVLQRQRGLALLLISHDLQLVLQRADAVAVMYCGRIVECGPAERIAGAAAHPYTRALLETARALRTNVPRGALPVIPGEVASPLRRPTGCAFHPRCALAPETERCQRETPELRGIAGSHVAACWRVEAGADGE